MVKKKRNFIWVILFVIVILIIAGVLIFFYLDNKSFSTKTVLLKLNIPLGGESISSIRILNSENFEQDFQLYFEDLEGFVSLSEDTFLIPSKSEKEIDIFFKDEKREVSVHSGYLIIYNENGEIRIPIVLGVEDTRSSFSIIQTGIPAYENVYPGGKFGADIKIYYIGAGIISQNVHAKYRIQDFEDNIIWTNEGDLTVGSTWSEIIPIDSSWEKGDYVFITEVQYDGVKSVAGYLFSVENKKTSFVFSNLKFYFLVIFVFLFGILVLFFYFLKTRDKLLIELKKQHNAELKRNVDYVKHLKDKVLKSKKKPVQKKKIIKNLEKAKVNIINKIKKKQKKQIKEANKLKKVKKKNVAKNEIIKWKKEGYKMSEADREIKKVMDRGLEQQINKWKNQGHFVD